MAKAPCRVSAPPQLTAPTSGRIHNLHIPVGSAKTALEEPAKLDSGRAERESGPDGNTKALDEKHGTRPGPPRVPKQIGPAEAGPMLAGAARLTGPDAFNGAGVVRMRFGLNDGQPKTLDEIGEIYGAPGERVGQIEADAMLKLRHPSRSQVLRDYL